jgi:hypothetical protein
VLRQSVSRYYLWQQLCANAPEVVMEVLQEVLEDAKVP